MLRLKIVFKMAVNHSDHRRWIREEKVKVAAAWGAELIHFLAALAILHQDDLKNRMNCTKTI